jgi:hypothetical protein
LTFAGFEDGEEKATKECRHLLEVIKSKKMHSNIMLSQRNAALTF